MEHASALQNFSEDVHSTSIQNVQVFYSYALDGVVKGCLSVAISLIYLIERYQIEEMSTKLNCLVVQLRAAVSCHPHLE